MMNADLITRDACGAVKSPVSGYWLNVTGGTGQGYGGKTNDHVLASFMSNVTAGTDPCG